MVKKSELLLISIITILSPLFFSFFIVNASPAIGSNTIKLQAIADAYVNSSNPDTNYGNLDWLYVSENSKQDYTYVMFDLSSLPSGANIIFAELRMHLSSTGGSIYGMPSDDIGAYYCSDNSWTENSITWNNRPTFNSEPTDIWSFGFMYYLNYKSWNITTDVNNAFPSGILTEVLKFESKTGEGYAVFDSTENDDKPILEIEYSTEPVGKVHLESTQDTGATNNLGLIKFEEYTSPLPGDIDVVAGTYETSYSGGYLFTRWETIGGVSVSNPTAVTTTVTVSGDGTLRAIGNVNRLEYTYDSDESLYGDSQTKGNMDAVRFTPLFSGEILLARFYFDQVSSYQANTIKVHLMDENRNDLITSFEQTPNSEGWFDVDISGYDINVTEETDFYIGLEWLTDNNPRLGVHNYNPSGRSWTWNGTSWEENNRDFMIRAVVGEDTGQVIPDLTILDHTIIAEGIDFHVITASSSTITNCQFNKDDKEFSFNVNESINSYGYCNVTIPNELLGGPFSITSNDLTVNEVTSSGNSTHTWLHFTYPQNSNIIEITGTTAIPEFPSWIILPLLLVSTFSVIVIKKMLIYQRS